MIKSFCFPTLTILFTFFIATLNAFAFEISTKPQSPDCFSIVFPVFAFTLICFTAFFIARYRDSLK